MVFGTLNLQVEVSFYLANFLVDVSKLQVRDLDADVIIEALKADAAAGKVTEMKLDGRITIIKE